MATVGIKIHKHHKKADGTYNVKIRVAHKGEKKYIDTPHFVVAKQLTAKLVIKDATLKQLLNKTLDDYRGEISKLGPKLDLYSAEALKNYLKDKPMDFLKFCKGHIDGLKKEGRKGSAGTLTTVLLSLHDYFNKTSITPLDINVEIPQGLTMQFRALRSLYCVNELSKCT